MDKVYHFDSKAKIADYIRSIGLPCSFFMPGFYMSNFTTMIREDPETHEWTLAFPTNGSAPAPLLATNQDSGKFVKAILLNREALLGKNVLGATDYYTLDEIVAVFKATHPGSVKAAKFTQVSSEVYKEGLAQAGMPEFAQEELSQNMQLLGDVGYYGGASLEESHSVSLLRASSGTC